MHRAEAKSAKKDATTAKQEAASARDEARSQAKEVAAADRKVAEEQAKGRAVLAAVNSTAAGRGRGSKGPRDVGFDEAAPPEADPSFDLKAFVNELYGP